MTDSESAISAYAYHKENDRDANELLPRLGMQAFSYAHSYHEHSSKRTARAQELELFRARKSASPLYGLKARLAVFGMEIRAGRELVRLAVRARDNFTCQDCGSVRLPDEVKKHNEGQPSLKGRIKLFDVHHLDGLCGKNSRGYDSTKDLSGLITLCHKCHYNRPEHRVHAPDFRKPGVVHTPTA